MLRRFFGHLITCRKATRLVSQEQDRELGPLDALLLKLHLAWCVACLQFQVQTRFLRRAMQRYRE
jgi:Putative zinc-finger